MAVLGNAIAAKIQELLAGQRDDFGGRAAFVAAARLNDRVKAAAIYYGGGIVAAQPGPAPVDRAPQIRCPVIAFYGALDKHIPQEHVERVAGALEVAGVNHQVYLYPYADHGFFCDAQATYHPRAAHAVVFRIPPGPGSLGHLVHRSEHPTPGLKELGIHGCHPDGSMVHYGCT